MGFTRLRYNNGEKLEALTLDQLKAQNAAEEAETETPQVEVETTEEADGEPEVISEKAAEPETDEQTDSKSEPWQESDEQGSKAELQVPVAAHARMRHKLKGTIGEKNEEIEQLRAQIDELRKGATVQAPADSAIPRPRPEDYDTDEQYTAALDGWYDKKVETKIQTFRQTDEQAIQQQRQAQEVAQAVDQHYAEAEQLATDNGIKPEMYQAADMAFRSVIERAHPKNGDAIADNLIARLAKLGQGSAKVTYFIGRNAKAQQELSESLAKDPTGIHAAMYLGTKMAEVAPPRRKVSQAPEPAESATGDIAVSQPGEKKYREAYRRADKAGDAQKRWDARMAAKKAGFDVSKW